MRLRAFAGLIASAFPLAAGAANGLNLIGFGAESVAMGGADTAAARDTSALNTNPAGLAQLARPAFAGYASAAFALDVGHADSLGNDRRVSNRVVPVGGFGASHPLAGGRLIAGIGFFAQGGSGAVYKDLRTPFGNIDELSAQVGFARLVPGLAWRVDDDFFLGAALPLNVLLAKQRVFPGTSVVDPADSTRSFFGLKLDDARGAAVGLRLGAMWKPAPSWSFGAAYAPKTKVDTQHGHAELNLSAARLGVVAYRDARIEGFALAREIALGVAWQATPRTLASLKLAHLDWSDALRSVTVTLRSPANPTAPAVVSQTSRVDWRDQRVVALGLAHTLSDALTAYGGYNHARNPTRPETLTPILAAIAKRHATGGLAWRASDGWLATAAIEYALSSRVRYRNPNVPLGDNAEERVRYVAMHFMLGRRW